MPQMRKDAFVAFFICAMPDNLTREEMESAQEGLIAPDASGPITSQDHRHFNSMIMDYLNSFLDFDTYTEAVPGSPENNSRVVDERLKKRLVSKVLMVVDNLVISEQYINKPLASGTLLFVNGQIVAPNTRVTISFKQQPI